MSDLQLLVQTSCPNTWGAYLSEAFNTYSDKVVSFGNHYYQQLPTAAQMNQFKDGVFSATAARYQQASDFARQAAADASVKFGEYSQTASEKLQEAGEFVRQNLPDLNNPQTVDMISKGVLISLIALNFAALAHTVYKNYTFNKRTQEVDCCLVPSTSIREEGPVCVLPQQVEIREMTPSEIQDFNQFFWDMNAVMDQMFVFQF